MVGIRYANPIAVDLQNIYISNFDSYRAEDVPEFRHAILKLGTDSTPLLLAGKTEFGFQDGPANQATFNKPIDVVSYRETLYVLDRGNNAIRKVDAQGNVTTFASATEGRGFKAPFVRMLCFTIDSSGTIYVVVRHDDGTHVIKITSTGEVTVFPNLLNYFVYSIAVNDSGLLYSTSPEKHCIYRAKLGVDDKATVFAGKEQQPGMVDATGEQSLFNQPWGLVVGSDGNVYVADYDNHSIRRVTPEGVVTTVAGDGNHTRIDGVGREASFWFPTYLAFHPSDRKLYVLEGDNDSLAIRSVDADTRAVATIYTAPEEEDNADDEEEDNADDEDEELPAFLIPPCPSKVIPPGSSDAISSDDIKEGSIVGQIIGEGGIIAKSDYYFPASLQNLWQQGPSKFLDPMTRQKIVDVKWYKAHFPEDPKGGRRTRKVKKVKKSRKTKKRTTYRVNRKKKTRTTRKSKLTRSR
jgi:DNA-binding beta-propeller fold protein YncE